MKRRMKNLLCTLLTVVLILCAVDRLSWLLRPVDLDIAADAVDAFHDLPKDSVDVLCLGSSHMWRGLDPLTMKREFGIDAYNYACVYQKINTTLLFLQDAFRTQSPRVVVIDSFYANRLNENPAMTNELYSTFRIRFSKEKLLYLHSLFGRSPESYFYYFFPFSVFHSNWDSLFSSENHTRITYRDFHETAGFAYSDSVVSSVFPVTKEKKQLPLTDEATAVLDEIVDLCREHRAELLFITIPYEQAYPYADAMTDFALSRHCSYLNLFDHLTEGGFDASADFSDYSHLNAVGAAKTASLVGRYIAEHFSATDDS